MSIGIDMVVLSTDEHENYFGFWPRVAWAYRRMLKVPVLLAFVTDREEYDPVVSAMRLHGEVHLLQPISDVPRNNQAKMARHYLASLQGDRVCYIDDIDLLPLSRQFIVDKVADRQPNHLLAVGAEFAAYGNNGVFSISQMTAEGHVFRSLFNPKGLEWSEFLRSFIGITSGRENIANAKPYWEGQGFSDEYLVRHLRKINPVPTQHKPRGFNWETQTIDRAFWNRFDQEKLNRGEYVFAHCLHPPTAYMHEFQPLLDFIDRTYPE